MKRLTLILCLIAGQSQAAVTQFWKLDDNAASTTVVATTGNNGVFEGGDNTDAHDVAGPGGVITAGLQFNGTDDGVDISGASLSFATGVAYSVSMWFKLDSAAASTQRLTGNTSGTTANTIQPLADTTIRVRQTATNSDFTVGAMGTTNWHHLLVTKTTGDSLRCFLDGTESSTGALSNTATFAPNRLARSSTVFGTVRMAYVRVYDTDESANVATLYAEGTASPNAPRAMHQFRLRRASYRPKKPLEVVRYENLFQPQEF